MNVKVLVGNVFKVHYILNVNLNVVKYYVVVIHVNKNVVSNAFVKKIVKIYVHTVIVVINALKFVSIVKKDALSVANMENVRKNVEKFVIGSLAKNDAKKK